MAKTEDEVLENAGFDVEQEDDSSSEPVYRVYKAARIPVSKAHGPLWRSRRDEATNARKQVQASWDECIRYFNNDQFSKDDMSRRQPKDGKRQQQTENIVYSNAATLLPSVYSKNPKIDITVDQSDMESEKEPDEDVTALNDFARVLSRLVNKLIGPQYLNLKPKARRQALFAILTNYGWLKLGWHSREFSSDDVQRELETLADEYAKAKTKEDIERIEGKLQAIEQKFDVLSDTGPYITVKDPRDILVDPSCTDVSDLSTANWLIEFDYLPTNMLRAMYMQADKDETNQDYTYLYKPTHTAVASETDGEDTDGVRFISWDGEGEENKDRFDDTIYTHVAFVYDKVTRRVSLYNNEDWTWPLWVWDDPLKLSRFFPFFGLAFAPSTRGAYAKGEVTYYLDQQDAINEINDQARKVRRWAFDKWIYNNNVISQTDVDRVINADGRAALGISIPEGMKAQDFWAPLLPPAAQHPELFNKEDLYKAIDRVSAVSDALRGAQFKTNTTNDAVSMYADAAKIRVGEKIDTIEEMLADLGRALAELCVANYTTEDVEKILSRRDAALWMQMTVREFNTTLTCSIVAGSTEKPTSANKQQQAIQTGQVLGQFAKATPVTVMIVLKMLERAFDNVIVSKEDFEQIEEAIKQSMGGQGGAGDPQQMQAALASLLKLVPPEVKQAIEAASKQGMSPMQAIEAVAQQAGANQPQQDEGMQQ